MGVVRFVRAESAVRALQYKLVVWRYILVRKVT